MLRVKMYKLINERGFSLLELLIMIIVIGLVFGIGWKVLLKKSSPAVKKEASTQTVTAEQDIMNDVAKQIVAKYNYMDMPSNINWIAQMGTGVVLTSDEYRYTIASTSFSVVKLNEKAGSIQYAHPAQFNEEIITAISKGLKSHGYTLTNKTYKLTNLGGDTRTLTYKMYASSNSNCLNTYDTSGGTITELSCFSNAAAKSLFSQAKPFVDEYVKNHPEIAQADITIGPLVAKSVDGSGVIGSSHEAGYDIGEAVFEVGDSRKIALFYNHLGGPWTYITQADDEYGFTCGSYTADTTIRKVMYNQICLGNKGHVRLDTNKRALQ